MCFKKHLTFLKYKENCSKSLSNRVVKKSNYMRSYKDINFFYVNYLRSNFLKNNKSKQFKTKFKNKDIYFFLNAYKQYLSLNDLNRALLWRMLQVDPIFKMQTTILKHKKIKIYSNRVYFMPQQFRILITWTWLKFFFKSLRGGSNYETIHLALEDFLTSHPSKHVITDIKYSVYKLQLLRSL